MDSRGDMKSNAAKVARLIDLKRAEIYNGWFGALRQKWSGRADQKVRTLIKHKKEKKDLLSLLLKILSDKSKIEKQNLDALLYRVRTQEYSIFDFFLEVSFLEESIKGVLRRSHEIKEAELLDGMDLIRKELSRVFGKILKETSGIYEHVIESGARGFCHVDKEGRIIFANKEMKRLLGMDSITGKRLHSFFDGVEKDFVRKTVSGRPGERPEMRQLQLKAADGKSTPVDAEIAAVLIDGQHRGAYACVVDISRATEMMMKIFDKSPLGIAKVNLKEQITYLNRKAFEIMGMDKWEQKALRDVFPDEENYKIVRSELKRRKKGVSDEYEIEITRLNDKKRVPVMISAFPETDLKGNVTGTMAIIRNIVREKAVEAIHKHIESERGGQALLKAVAEEMERVIPFQLFVAAAYSADMRHSRAIFNYSPSGQLEWRKRWWEMTPANRKFINRKKIRFGNLPDILAQKQWKHLRDDRDIKKILNAGFRSFIFYPVIREDRVCASVSLFSKSENAFDSSHVELLGDLPLGKALLTALYYEENEDLKFRLDLIRKISCASNNMGKVAAVIVSQLAKHYDWQDISLYRVDEEHGAIRLLSQEASSEAFRLPGDYKQHIDEGILGYVYKNKVATNVGNVRTDPKFKDVYKDTLKDTVSELCLPISIDGKVCWLLNIQDSRQNAFSEEEKKALEGVFGEVTEFLERSRLHHFVNATLQFASDAIIVTDTKGNINRVNQATKKLLGYSKAEMVGSTLKDYFKDVDVAEGALKAEKFPSYEVTLRHKTGDEANVLLSASQLPEEVGGKVFIAKDLSLHKRVEELEYLGKMYYEIATQTETPLSVVFSWLNRLKRETEDSSTVETLDKAIRQLHKVQLTYDRLALYDKGKGVVPYHDLLLDISEVLDSVMDEFPKTEVEKIDIKLDKEMPYLRGDLFQLSFCFGTILSYLLRFVPEEERIRLRISHDQDWLVTEISGFFPGIPKEKSEEITKRSSISHTLTEMALGEKIIRTFIEDNHRGKFYEPKRKGEKIEFRINLPIAKGY